MTARVELATRYTTILEIGTTSVTVE